MSYEADLSLNPTTRYLLSKLRGVRRGKDGWMALCPAHADQNPSLHITVTAERTLLHCFAGCPVNNVLAEAGLVAGDLRAPVLGAPPTCRPSGRGWPNLQAASETLARLARARVEEIHEYHDLDGEVRFAVIRLRSEEGKTFRPVHLRDRKWHSGDPDRLLPLFQLHVIRPASSVLVVEGEKCARAAAALGIAATTSPHGANSAANCDWNPIARKDVTIWPDNDEPGRTYAQDVTGILRTINPEVSIRIVNVSGLPEGGDVADWITTQKADDLTDEEIGEGLSVLLEGAEPVPHPDFTYSTDSTGRVGGSASWPPPRPIAKANDPPPFPIETAFAPGCSRLRDFVLAVAESYQVPVDLPAMLALAAFGLPLSKTIEVSPMPDWREPLAIYVLSLLASGERKSPVFARMINPIREWQRQRGMSLQLSIISAENDIKLTNEKLGRRRADAARGKPADEGDESMDELLRHLAKLEQEKPRPPSLIATEITTEAIAELLVENDERGLIAAAEGDTLDVMLGRYNQGKPNFGLWLSGHAGDAIDIRRKGRPPLRLARPALTVALSVQPEAIADLMASRAAAGRGVLARFFFSRPKSLLGHRDLCPARIPTDDLDWYGSRLHQLLDRGVPKDPDILHLSPGANDLFLEFRAWVERELRPNGQFSDHTAWGAKLAGAIARIAGVLHGIADPTRLKSAIEAHTMAAALAWAPYLEAHERHVAWLAGDDSASLIAERILAWARRPMRQG